MKLIQTKEYLLLIDEEAEIKEGKTFITKDNIIHSNYGYNYGDRVVIAYYPLTKEAKELDLPLLPNPSKEVDIEDLAFQSSINYYGSGNMYYKNGFINGYKAVQAKQFSLEDMKKAIEMAREIKDNKDIFDIDSISGLTEVCTYDWEERYSTEEIIQSLSTQQLPKEFIPEYETPYSDGFTDDRVRRFYGKPELKTITNSEGKEVIQGKWIY